LRLECDGDQLGAKFVHIQFRWTM